MLFAIKSLLPFSLFVSFPINFFFHHDFNLNFSSFCLFIAAIFCSKETTASNNNCKFLWTIFFVNATFLNDFFLPFLYVSHFVCDTMRFILKFKCSQLWKEHGTKNLLPNMKVFSCLRNEKRGNLSQRCSFRKFTHWMRYVRWKSVMLCAVIVIKFDSIVNKWWWYSW